MECRPWGSPSTSYSRQSARSSNPLASPCKNGVVHHKIVPNLKEEGELVNGSHGNKHMIKILAINMMKHLKFKKHG